MSNNKSRHRQLLFISGLVLFSLLGSMWISSNNGVAVHADNETSITQNSTGSGNVVNQQEEPQKNSVNSNTTDNTNPSDDQISQSKLLIQKHNREHQLIIISRCRRALII